MGDRFGSRPKREIKKEEGQGKEIFFSQNTQEHVKDKEHALQQEEIDLDKLRRQTYYITELYIKAIEQMAFYEKMDKSEIVRTALEQFVPKKYINLAIRE